MRDGEHPSQSERPRVLLRVRRGRDKGKFWDLTPGEAYVMGRSRTCNVCLQDKSVSARHAKLECEHDVWFLEDVESSHGTLLNNQKILLRKPVFDRDLIRLGRTVLEFREYEPLSKADLAEIDRGVQFAS